MNGKYTEEFRLRIGDFNNYDRILPSAVLDLFQDVAATHANMIGVGYDDMLAKKLFWVLLRTKYEVIKQAKEYGKVKAVTWPKARGKANFDREYLLLDENDEVLVKGVSKWVVISAETRRFTPAKDLQYNCDVISDENFPGPFNKIDDFAIEDCSVYEDKARYCDLDHNGHVNNIMYAKYVLNALELKEDEIIKIFEIDYLSEMKLNQEFKIYFKREGKVAYAKGVFKENENVSFVCRITFE